MARGWEETRFLFAESDVTLGSNLKSDEPDNCDEFAAGVQKP